MDVQFFIDGVTVRDDERAYVEEKIARLSHFAHELDDASVSCRVDIRSNKIKTSDRCITVHVTLVVPHAVIRAEEDGVTVQEATDLTVEKLERQIARYKGKHHRRTTHGEWIPSSTLEELTEAQQEVVSETRVVKRKRFTDVRLLHEDEAIEQLELIGHDFFVFDNKDSGFLSIAYKRDDGSYGVIEIDKASVKQW